MKRVVSLLGVLMLVVLPLSANIYIDEGFEDASPFTDNNWPTQDDTTPPSQSLIDTYQGINIRASASDQISPAVAITNTGTVSTAAAYKGSQSLELASGQSFFTAGPYVNMALNWIPTTQFAITVSTPTLSLAPGTQVGHYRQNWSTDGDNATIEVAYQVNFVVNASGTIDIVLQNTGGTVGQISDPGWFKVITVAVNKNNTVADGKWECYDPLTATYKGPQPVGDPANDGGTTPSLAPGFNLFVNSNTPANILVPANFGSPNENNCFCESWELVAENGGTLYVDEYFWSVGYFQMDHYWNEMNKDCSARINGFIAPVPPAPPSNSAADWNLFY